MDDDLDDLLNDALSDFDKPPPDVGKVDKGGSKGADGSSLGAAGTEKTQRTESGGASEGAGLQPPKEIFEQFFDKDMSDRLQREWDSAMKELVEEDPALASQLHNLSSTLDSATDAAEAAGHNASQSTPKDEEKQSASTSGAAASSASSSEGQQTAQVADMNKIIDAAISGIGGSADELQNMSSADAEEKLLKEMRNMGLGGGMPGMMGDMGGLEGDFMQMMEGMMGNLLSKDVLYPTMKEISNIYPQWLVDNEGKIPDGEFQRYKEQNKIIDNICKAFEEEEGEDEPKEVKSQRLNVMMNLVEQMQECGNPPKDLLEKCAGGSGVDMGKFFGSPLGFDPSAFNPNDLNPEGCNVM